ncbi:uncharacterized protein TNCV_4421041 [Trichonephila clavipes]|nr:uncharacterized protein TNCV_4421041 [Trichonephila clavipes]
MAPHTITPAVGGVCCYKAKAGLRSSPRGLHTRTRLSSLLRLNLHSLLKTICFHSTAVQFPRVWHHSKRRYRWEGVKGSTRNGRRDPKCLSTRRLRILFYSKDNLVALDFKYDFWRRTDTAGSHVVQSGRPIFDDFFQHLWPYIGNNTVNVVFQMVKRLWLIRIDQLLYIAPQKIV